MRHSEASSFTQQISHQSTPPSKPTLGSGIPVFPVVTALISGTKPSNTDPSQVWIMQNVKPVKTIKKPTCCFRVWMAVITENQGTASLCHLEGKEALKNVHSPFNALKHLIWSAYTMNDSVGDIQEDKSTILWVEASRYLKEKTSRSCAAHVAYLWNC